MATLVVIAWIAYLALAFGYRTYAQRRATGHSGFVAFRPGSGAIERFAGGLFFVAVVLGFTGAVSAAAWPKAPLLTRLVPTTLVQLGLGGVLYVLGLVLTLRAQAVMGESWRIGVDPSERTKLVTSSFFNYVRNPIFTAMLITGAGIVLLHPTAIAAVAYACLTLAIELQVRLVEEPYLRAVHGKAYLDYAASAGRFVPALGRLRDPRTRSARPARAGHHESR